MNGNAEPQTIFPKAFKDWQISWLVIEQLYLKWISARLFNKIIGSNMKIAYSGNNLNVLFS